MVTGKLVKADPRGPSPALADSGFRLKAPGANAPHAFNTPQLWMALGGLFFPQLAATSVNSGLFRPDLNRNAARKLAPTKIAGAQTLYKVLRS